MPIREPRRGHRAADIAWGIKGGAFVGLLFGIRYGLAAAINSSRPLHNSVGSPWLVGVITFAGALLAGALIGAFRSFARRPLGAVTLGIGAVFPVLVGVDVLRGQIPFPPEPINWRVDIISAVLLGSLGGLVVWATTHSDRAA